MKMGKGLVSPSWSVTSRPIRNAERAVPGLRVRIMPGTAAVHCRPGLDQGQEATQTSQFHASAALSIDGMTATQANYLFPHLITNPR